MTQNLGSAVAHLRFIRPLLVVSAVLLAAKGVASAPIWSWTMLNVSPAREQADCHVLRTGDGRCILIDIADAGDAPGIVIPLLKLQGVQRVTLLVISHFHRDHYGRLLELLDSDIKVDQVALNIPDEAAARREYPWGCDIEDVRHVVRELSRRKIPCFTPRAGDRLIQCQADGAVIGGLDVLACYDGLNTPIGPTDVNDTSIVLRLWAGRTRVLFTGDLNRRLGEYLVKSGMDLKADILKAPHHGGESTVPSEFYDAVGAKLLLVPTSRTLWESPRCMRTRLYFGERGIPTLVSGINGHVKVEIQSSGYTVEKEQ